MRNNFLRALFVLVLLVALQAGAPVQGSGTVTAHYFPETGHTVSDLFLKYWNSQGGLVLFGYPISDEFSEKSATDGATYTVQYFERAVFELHPTNIRPYVVLQTLLGGDYYKGRYPNGATQQPAGAGRDFPETGHRIGGRFLSFWESNGGLPTLGYPLSDELTEKSELNGKTYRVQYFERAVLELHPENSAPNDVLLTQLGKLRFNSLYADGAPQQQRTALTGPSAAPGDWPMYGHDPQHTNFNAAEKNIGAGMVNNLASLWQAEVGIGANPSASAPSVHNGKVYVGSSMPTGPNFFAFDAASGSQLWSRDLGYKDTCYKIGIGATAAISGSMVVAGGGDGAYYGLNADTGAVLWRDPMDQEPDNFAWASPVLVNGRAIYGKASYCDHPPRVGEVRSTDMATGVLRNELQLVPTGSMGTDLWNSPALSPDGSKLFVATGELRGTDTGPYTQAMVSLDPTSFEVFESDQEGELNEVYDLDWGSSPIVFHDATGRMLVAAHHKNDRFYAYDMNNISAGPLWVKHSGTQIGLMAAYDPTARAGGILLVTAKGGYLYAVDPATGENLWFASDLGVAHGNIAVANGLIFMNIDKVGVRILDVQTGEVLRTLVPENVGRTFSGIAVADGVIYWSSGTYLNAWALR